MKKRTKIIIITVMVLLLGVTGFLNVMLNNSVSNSDNDNTQTTASYFQTYRSDRESTRDQEMLYYDAIIASETSTEDAIKSAEEGKLALIEQMEQELVVEGLIKAKGFEDCVVTISGENINAVVKASELSSAQVAQIVSILQAQFNVDIDNIKIIPVE